MNNPLTREEIQAIIDIQVKATLQMEQVVIELKRISQMQEKIMTRLYNGMSKEICSDISNEIKESSETLIEDQKRKETMIEEIRDNIRISKWTIISTSGLLALVFTVFKIVQFISK